MTRLLITGSSGFIGRNIAEQLQFGYDVTAPSRAALDLLDDGAVQRFIESRSFDVIIHCATVRSNRKLGAPSGLLRDNCRMFFNLVRNSSRFGKMVYFGSGKEYDSRHTGPLVREDGFDTHVPDDEYGFSKYICARAASQIPNVYELCLFAVFGPYENWDVRFLSNSCCRVLWDLPIVIRQNVLFDYLDVRDLGRIVEWFVGHQPRWQRYNVCSGQAWDLKTLASKVLTASGKRLDIVVKQDGLGREYSGDNARLIEELGDFHFREIDQSIGDLYHWYLERRDTIDPALLHFDA